MKKGRRHTKETKRKISESMKKRVSLHHHMAKGSLIGAGTGATLQGIPAALIGTHIGGPMLGIPLTISAMGRGAIEGGTLGGIAGAGTYYAKRKFDTKNRARYEYKKDLSVYDFTKKELIPYNFAKKEQKVKSHTRRTKRGTTIVNPFVRVKRYFNPEPAKGSIYTAPFRYAALSAQASKGKFQNLIKDTPNPKEATERLGATIGVGLGRLDTLRKKIRDRGKDFTRGIKLGRRSEGVRDTFERHRLGENIGVVGGLYAASRGLKGTGIKTALVQPSSGLVWDDQFRKASKGKKALIVGGGLVAASQIARITNRYLQD
jgi:hypothetical protein